MTPLRQRMIEDLKLRGYSDSTQTLYVDAVRHLCEHFAKSPGKMLCIKLLPMTFDFCYYVRLEAP